MARETEVTTLDAGRTNRILAIGLGYGMGACGSPAAAQRNDCSQVHTNVFLIGLASVASILCGIGSVC